MTGENFDLWNDSLKLVLNLELKQNVFTIFREGFFFSTFRGRRYTLWRQGNNNVCKSILNYRFLNFRIKIKYMFIYDHIKYIIQLYSILLLKFVIHFCQTYILMVKLEKNPGRSIKWILGERRWKLYQSNLKFKPFTP